jgi:hypothetical protein
MKALPRILEAGRVDPAGRRAEQRLERATQESLDETRASQERRRARRDEWVTAAEVAKAAVELCKCGDGLNAMRASRQPLPARRDERVTPAEPGKTGDELIPGDRLLDGRSRRLLDLAASGVGALASASEPTRLLVQQVEAQLEASLEALRRARRA